MKIYNFNEFERQLCLESEVGNTDFEQINEGLFGIGSPSKPSMTLTADYIREHTPEEIGQIFFENVIYFMDKANYEVDKAIDMMNEKMKDIWADVKNSAETAKNFINGIIYSVKGAISNKFKQVGKYATALPNMVLCGICYLVKLGVSGVDAAKQAIKTLNKDIADFMKKTYDAISEKLTAAGEKVANVINTMKDQISIFAKVSAAIVVITAKKIEGIGEDLKNWVTDLLAKAKENALLAVMTVKDWVMSKATDVVDFVKSTAKEVAEGIETAWNNLKDDAKKIWDKTTGNLNEWIGNIKMVAANIAKKAGEIAKAAGEKLISIKDAGAATVIKKGVKALNKDNYSLDDVIDMVTTAYNESMYYMSDGSVMLNETEFYKSLNIIVE